MNKKNSLIHIGRCSLLIVDSYIGSNWVTERKRKKEEEKEKLNFDEMFFFMSTS